MSNLFSKLKGFFSAKTLAGVDKSSNRYFTRKEEIDGIMKEKRWVIFKGEDDPTSIPVLKKEGERKASGAHLQLNKNVGKDGSPDLKSFIQQFPGASFDHSKGEEESTAKDDTNTKDRFMQAPTHARARTHKNSGITNFQSQLDLVNHSNQGHGSHRHEVKQPFCNTSLSRLTCGYQLFENSQFACSPSEADPVTSTNTSTFCSLLKGNSGSTKRFTIQVQERTLGSFSPYEWTPLTRWFAHWLSSNNIQKQNLFDT